MTPDRTGPMLVAECRQFALVTDEAGEVLHTHVVVGFRGAAPLADEQLLAEALIAAAEYGGHQQPLAGRTVSEEEFKAATATQAPRDRARPLRSSD